MIRFSLKLLCSWLSLAALLLSATAMGAVWAASPAAATRAAVAPAINQTAGQMYVGKSKTLRITASGYPKPTMTESGALPSGVSFEPFPGYALLTGTPAAGTGDDYPITLTASNSAGSDVEAYDLTVVQNPLYPTNFCPSPMTVGQYSHYEQSVASYPAFFGLGLNTTSPPDGVSFTQAPNQPWETDYEDLGTTSGTPAPGTGGKYHLQYSADNSPPIGGVTKNTACTVIINEAPTFTDEGAAVITAGTKLATPLVIGGTTGYPKTITASESGALPSGLTEQIKQSGKAFGAILRGTPTANSTGVYPITVTGNNGITSSETFILVVRAAGASPAATTLTLSTEPATVPYGATAQTYTATVSGTADPTGYVQFSIGNGLTTVPLSAGSASFTTPATLDAGDYTVTASYSGNPSNAASSDSGEFSVTPAPTTLTLSGPSSTAFGVPATFTTTVACTPSCGTTPAGLVAFDLGGDEYDVDLVGGQATIATDPTVAPSLDNEVDATFSAFPDAPGDFAPSTPASASYDVGTVDIPTVVGVGTLAGGTSPVSDGDTVTVDPADATEFSAALSAVDTGNGTPPGPLVFDITVGSTDETTTLVTQSGTQDAPSIDPQTGQSDYYWTIPANALTALSSSGSATVTISSPGSDDFVPDSVTFTLDWPPTS